jgi:hypothetical protein
MDLKTAAEGCASLSEAKVERRFRPLGLRRRRGTPICTGDTEGKGTS